MIKSDAKLKKLSEVFRMDNSKLITEAIELLRDEQPFEGAVSLMASLYDRSTDDEILRSVENFMNDLRDQSAAPEIISEIMHKRKAETTRMLVASCWQSGLDYASYTPELVNLFLSSDYSTAIECLTVIGESAQTISSEKKQMLITLIDKKIKSLNPEMKNLADELKATLT